MAEDNDLLELLKKHAVPKEKQTFMMRRHAQIVMEKLKKAYEEAGEEWIEEEDD